MGKVYEVAKRTDWHVLLEDKKKKAEPPKGEIEPMFPQLSQELLLPETLQASGGYLFKGLVYFIAGIVGLFIIGPINLFHDIRQHLSSRREG